MKKLDMPTAVDAHAGFLACARSLIPCLTEEITRQVSLDKNISNVLFTGHSAGGAVSSLIFLHFASNSTAQRMSPTLHAEFWLTRRPQFPLLSSPWSHLDPHRLSPALM
jgi:hypothetical protein